MDSTDNTQRSPLALDRLTAVWVALVLVTLVSFWIGTDHGLESARWSAAAVVGLGFVKASFVIRVFMESGRTPRPLQRAFDLWLVATAAIVIGVLLLA